MMIMIYSRQHYWYYFSSRWSYLYSHGFSMYFNLRHMIEELIKSSHSSRLDSRNDIVVSRVEFDEMSSYHKEVLIELPLRRLLDFPMRYSSSGILWISMIRWLLRNVRKFVRECTDVKKEKLSELYDLSRFASSSSSHWSSDPITTHLIEYQWFSTIYHDLSFLFATITMISMEK